MMVDARRNAGKVAFWSLVLLGLLLGSGCKIPASGKGGSSVDLLSVLRQMPDSLLENPFGERQGFSVTATEIDQLIAEKELQLPQGVLWQWLFQDSAHTKLILSRSGTEDGLSYDFLQLSHGYVLILQKFGDHCCSYSRWGLYKVSQGKLVDETAQRMPVLDWADFFTPAQIAGARPDAPAMNRYPFYMETSSLPARIEISIVADYLDLNYPAEQVSGMLSDVPSDPRVLEWRDQHFVWRED